MSKLSPIRKITEFLHYHALGPPPPSERDIVFVQTLNRDPSDATAIVYSNDDMNIILVMSLSYYAEYLLGSEARLEQVECNRTYCSYVSPQRWRPTS